MSVFSTLFISLEIDTTFSSKHELAIPKTPNDKNTKHFKNKQLNNFCAVIGCSFFNTNIFYTYLYTDMFQTVLKRDTHSS